MGFAMSDGLSELVAGALQRMRQSKDLGELASVAADAADAIEARVGVGSTEADRQALLAVKRFTYNVAADCWPGWTVPDLPPDPGILAAGRDLARRSLGLVRKLGLGSIQKGTGIWLVGAFELALGRNAEAAATFADAREHYLAGGAPGLVLLTEGYIAIAHGGGELEAVCGKIAAGGFENGAEFVQQLRTALRALGRWRV